MAKGRRSTPQTDAPDLTLSTAPPKRQIGIRVPSRMGHQLEAKARAENNSVSSVVRRLLTAALAGGDEAA